MDIAASPDPHHEVERHLLAGFPRFAHLAGDIADGDLHGVSVMRHGGHEIVETVLEMHDAAHRDDEVDQREHEQHPAQPVDGGQRQPVGDTCNLWLDHRRDEHAAHAEHERPQQADAPVKIEFVVGVVPPAGMKQRLHDPGCDVFQYAGPDHRKQEHHQGIVHLSQHHDGADRAAP